MHGKILQMRGDENSRSKDYSCLETKDGRSKHKMEADKNREPVTSKKLQIDNSVFLQKEGQDYIHEENRFMEEKSKGRCNLCNGEFYGKDIRRHINKCVEEIYGKNKAFLMKASAGAVWVYFLVPKHKMISSTYKPLRDIWFECCDHLSPSDENYIIEEDKNSEKELAYDHGKENSIYFGNDFIRKTEVAIEFICETKTKKEGIFVVAKNIMPSLDNIQTDK